MRPAPLRAEALLLLASLDRESRVALIHELSSQVARGASDDDLIEDILDMLEREQDVEVLDAWVTYIMSSGAPRFLDVLAGWIDVADEEGRLGMIAAIATNRSPDASRALIDLISKDESLRVRRSALRYLVRQGTRGKWEPHSLDDVVSEECWRPATYREYKKLIDSGGCYGEGEQ